MTSQLFAPILGVALLLIVILATNLIPPPRDVPPGSSMGE